MKDAVSFRIRKSSIYDKKSNTPFKISRSKFYNFINQRLKYEINRHSSKELNKDEIIFYTKELNKILIKWKPVIDNLSLENNK